MTVDDPGTKARSADLTRRRVLRGSALAGGTLWAVPTVQVLGLGQANAAVGSPPPPPPPPDPPDQCQDISNIQVIVSKLVRGATVYYGLKWDPEDVASGEGWAKWSSAAPDQNDCIQYFESATGNTVVAHGSVADAFNGEGPANPVVVDMISDCVWRVRLPLPTGYTYVDGYMKFGDVSEDSNDGNENCPKGGTVGATYIEFSTV